MKSEYGAQLISLHGARARVRMDTGEEKPAKLHLSQKGLVAGDELIVDNEGDHLKVISARPRRSELARFGYRGSRKVIAANIDTLAIVVAPEPEPFLGLLDRYLIAAELNRLRALLIWNKADLSPGPILAAIQDIYPALGITVLTVSTQSGSGVGQLQHELAGCATAFLGQSGVGKSSLINSVLGQEYAKVGMLSDKRVKGRHTTTASRIYWLQDGGWILDSPGVRDFDPVGQVSPQRLTEGFPEIAQAALACQFRNCLHGQDKGCAIPHALESGAIHPQRLASWRQLVTHLTVKE